MQTASQSELGFTLLELMIVLLISIIGYAAVSTNVSSGNQTTKIQVAARDLASALRYAHGQALVDRIPVSVAINLENNTYLISDQDKQFQLPSELEISVVIAEQEFAQGQLAGIRFFSDGSSTGGRITLVWGKQLRRIDVNWITGEVTLSDSAV